MRWPSPTPRRGTADRGGFNYRNAPAVQAARRLIADGRPAPSRMRGSGLLSDYAAHPDGALTWRYPARPGRQRRARRSGSHGVDLVRYLLGDIDSLIADTAVFIPERSEPSGATSGHQLATSGCAATSRTRTTCRRSCDSRRELDAYWRPVVWPWGSRTPTGLEIHGNVGDAPVGLPPHG